MKIKMDKAALGFRSHSGWAAMVVVAASRRSVRVLLRRRIVTADSAIRGSKQPYHTAERWPIERARQFIDQCTLRSYALAEEAIAAALAEIHRKVAGAGLLMASGRTAVTLEAALASHAALHTAEGELYRDAIAHGCGRSGVAVTRVREKELFSAAGSALGMSEAKVRSRLMEMGKEIGPPWSQDEKLAALAAWVALAGAGARKRKVAKATAG